MAYLTNTQYLQITRRDPSEATPHRLELASALLDARLGRASSDGTAALAVDDLTERQATAVREWVARCIETFAEDGATPKTVERISLGKFSVTPGEQESPMQRLGFADALLANTGMIRRSLRTTRRGPFGSVAGFDDLPNYPFI